MLICHLTAVSISGHNPITVTRELWLNRHVREEWPTTLPTLRSCKIQQNTMESISHLTILIKEYFTEIYQQKASYYPILRSITLNVVIQNQESLTLALKPTGVSFYLNVYRWILSCLPFQAETTIEQSPHTVKEYKKCKRHLLIIIEVKLTVPASQTGFQPILDYRKKFYGEIHLKNP